jgi:hypothetical protein
MFTSALQGNLRRLCDRSRKTYHASVKPKPPITLVLSSLVFSGIATHAGILDSIRLGDASSEAVHHFSSGQNEIIPGGLGESARRLPAPATSNWEGGRMSFELAVDPEKQNYVTARFWGSDAPRDMLILFCDGKQLGYRHLGDIEALDVGGGSPAFPGRFFYNTSPLPLGLTHGKTNLNFELRSTGPVWAYGSTFEEYQKPMTEPTRGLYKFYTHTDGYFIPPADEKQGRAIVNPPVRTAPGEEVMEQLKKRVNGELIKQINSQSPLNQMQMQMLARAYHVKWSVAYHNPKALEQLVRSLDAIFVAYRKNPRLAESDPATWNAEWFGLGPSGDVIRLVSEELKPLLDAEIDDGAGTKMKRRAAFCEMLIACRDWHRKHRRLYTNQSMINDVYGIYLANRGLEVVAPEKALSELEVRRYLYESVGLERWRDSDPGGSGPAETGGRNWNVGTNYWELTAKALTKELGYVGYYGEVLDWMTTIYNATRPALDQPGDEKIRAQLVRAAHARGVFRYAAVDDEGNRAMRVEAVIGWRDSGHYPGDVAYAQRISWDGSPLDWVAATLDPDGIGYVQQMFADNQFFALMRERMADDRFRVTAALLGVPDEYELLKSQPAESKRLPMSPGQPNFIFTDEEDGVVAVKNGDEVLYASLYWRARNAVNFLARVHFTTPTIDRIAVVSENAEFEARGEFYTRPDWVNFGFANGGPKYPVEMHSALAGEKLPIAKIPAGIQFRPGDENVFAGRADFYTLRYGNYLIGMNTRTDKTFELRPPAGIAEARDLASGKTVQLAQPIKVSPRSTVILRLPTN